MDTNEAVNKSEFQIHPYDFVCSLMLITLKLHYPISRMKPRRVAIILHGSRSGPLA